MVSEKFKGRLEATAAARVLSAAIQEWNTRIKPTIDNTIAEANRRSAETGIHLNVVYAAGQYLTRGDTLAFPQATISAQASAEGKPSRAERVARQLPGGGSDFTLKLRGDEPQLILSVDAHGRVQMTVKNCDIQQFGPLSPDQYTTDTIENAIADLIDSALLEK
jgi:hypothetical protein